LLTLHFSTQRPGTAAPSLASLPQADLDQLVARLAARQSPLSNIQLQVTPKPQEEAWVQGVGADGSPRPGPADDIKPLAKAENSVCFLTDIEIQHVSDPGDQLACRVSVDEFTGFWEVHAIQGEGTDASVRCNASCLSW
jgi:hypothetical protein